MAILSENSGDAPWSVGTQYEMSVGDVFRGTLHTPDDTDAIRIHLSAGTSYVISLEGMGSAPVADTYLRIFESNGDEIAFDDDGGVGFDSLLTFTPTVSGTYYIGASSFVGGHRGGYEISVNAEARNTGTEGSDTLEGGSGSDTLSGLGGSDTLRGNDGEDRLLGGTGNDVVSGGRGGDWLWGQNGDDYLFGGDGVDILFGMSGNDVLFGDYGGDILLGGSGNDYIYGDYGGTDDGTPGARNGDGNDRVWGEGGNDTIWGEGGDDFLAGGTGNDQLYGEGGRDYLAGESGHDYLVGGSGYDVVAGGSGNDLLIGGTEGDTFFGQQGADDFYYNGGTLWVMDFGDGEDSVFYENATPANVVQDGDHTRFDMSDGGTIYLAWTNASGLRIGGYNPGPGGGDPGGGGGGGGDPGNVDKSGRDPSSDPGGPGDGGNSGEDVAVTGGDDLITGQWTRVDDPWLDDAFV